MQQLVAGHRPPIGIVGMDVQCTWCEGKVDRVDLGSDMEHPAVVGLPNRPPQGGYIANSRAGMPGVQTLHDGYPVAL